MAVKFLTSSGGGTTSDAILATDYAQSAGADVINADQPLLQVLERAAGVETVEVRFPMNGHSRGFMRFAYTRPTP